MRIPSSYRQRLLQGQIDQQVQGPQQHRQAEGPRSPFEGFGRDDAGTRQAFLGREGQSAKVNTPRYFGNEGVSPNAKSIAEETSRWNTFSWGRGSRGGAGRDIWKGKTERDFGTRGKEWGVTESGAAGEEDKDKKWHDDWSANATLYNVGVGARTNLAEAKGEVELPGGIKGKGSVYAGGLEAMAGGNVGVDLKSGDVNVGGFAKTGAHLVGARGSIGGEWGSDQHAVGTKLLGRAFVGSELGANAGVTLNPRNGTAKLGAGLDAFAGAKASATLRPNIRFMGEDISSYSGVTGEVYAGIGAKAKGDIGFEKGRFKASVELGAALGVGAGVKLNLDVNVVGTARAAYKAGAVAVDKATEAGRYVADKAVEAGSYVADKASQAAGAVADVASAGYDAAKEGTKSAFKSVKRFFGW